VNKKRQGRAASLRRQIDQLKKRGGQPPPPKRPETPAEFIHRRMAELETEKRKRKTKS
jgi:hypothetical protein